MYRTTFSRHCGTIRIACFIVRQRPNNSSQRHLLDTFCLHFVAIMHNFWITENSLKLQESRCICSKITYVSDMFCPRTRLRSKENGQPLNGPWWLDPRRILILARAVQHISSGSPFWSPHPARCNRTSGTPHSVFFRVRSSAFLLFMFRLYQDRTDFTFIFLPSFHSSLNISQIFWEWFVCEACSVCKRKFNT